MNKHTPGPWTWTRSNEPGEVITWTLDGPRVLCRWWEGIGKPGSHDADARLIAAAPELLAALERLQNPDLKPKILDYQRARNAIAKAKGGET